MTGETLYLVLVAAAAGELLVALAVARRNARWLRDRGARELGRGHYPAMVAVHVGLVTAPPAEVLLLDRPFDPLLGWPMLGLTVAGIAMRWWSASALGRRWTTRVFVLPGAGLVRRGPYRVLRHPNYVGVVAEVVALPLVHGAWLSSLVLTVALAAVLARRLAVESEAVQRMRRRGTPSPGEEPGLERVG